MYHGGGIEKGSCVLMISLLNARGGDGALQGRVYEGRG